MKAFSLLLSRFHFKCNASMNVNLFVFRQMLNNFFFLYINLFSIYIFIDLIVIIKLNICIITKFRSYNCLVTKGEI